ncbi:MAG: isochorismate synthase [Sporolactobacillus sp.]
MNITHKASITAGLTEAANRAQQMGKPVLFSYSQLITCDSPFTFLRSGETYFKNERFLFRHEQLTLAGLGTAMTVTANGESRFATVAERWRQATETVVALTDQTADTVRPLLFGGFSFDSADKHSPLWTPYSDALFYLPTWLLHCRGQRSVLTHFIRCLPNCPPDQLAAQFKHEEDGVPAFIQSERPHSIQPPRVNALQNREQWRRQVNAAVQTIKDGAMKKIVLSRSLQLSWATPPDWLAVLERLNQQQEGNFIFALERAGRVFLGATPERLLKKQGQHLETACVAGSAPRGQTASEDQSLAEALLKDHKNRQEHQYVVQMITRAIKEYAAALDFPAQPQIMKNKTIQHLYTPVTAVATGSLTLFDWLQKLHPTPALGGLPQQDALYWLRVHEGLDRGFYGAPIGWCDSDGSGEFAVAIRSAIFWKEKAILYAGCGVVATSDPDSEFDETALKFRPILDAL